MIKMYFPWSNRDKKQAQLKGKKKKKKWLSETPTQTGPLIDYIGWASTVCWPSVCLPAAIFQSLSCDYILAKKRKKKAHRIEATFPKPHNRTWQGTLLIPEPI